MGRHYTVCLGSTKCLCLYWKLKQVNLIGLAEKVVSVIEMTHLYSAGGSFHTLRTKKHDQTANTKRRKVDLYGEIGMSKFSNFISERQEGPRQSEFFPEVRYQTPGKKEISKKAQRGAKKQINTTYLRKNQVS